MDGREAAASGGLVKAVGLSAFGLFRRLGGRVGHLQHGLDDGSVGSVFGGLLNVLEPIYADELVEREAALAVQFDERWDRLSPPVWSRPG
jgi:hypothetical protein